MVWFMMAMETAEPVSTAKAASPERSAKSLSVYAIPDETDEEFADFMFSRKTDAVIDERG